MMDQTFLRVEINLGYDVQFTHVFIYLLHSSTSPSLSSLLGFFCRS